MLMAASRAVWHDRVTIYAGLARRWKITGDVRHCPGGSSEARNRGWAQPMLM
jgi:hypothetical protein